MSDLSIKDYLVVKAKLPHEMLHHQSGDKEGEALSDDELMAILMNYYSREILVKRMRKFKKDVDDVLAMLEPTVLR